MTARRIKNTINGIGIPRQLPLTNAEYEGGRPVTELPCVQRTEIPAKNWRVPRVAKIGGSLVPATNRPLMAPVTAPSRRAAGIANPMNQGGPAFIVNAAAIAARFATLTT